MVISLAFWLQNILKKKYYFQQCDKVSHTHKSHEIVGSSSFMLDIWEKPSRNTV